MFHEAKRISPTIELITELQTFILLEFRNLLQ